MGDLRFGLAGGPLVGRKVLAKQLTGGYWRGDAWAVIVIGDDNYTAANIYPTSGFGPKYNPEHYRHPFRPEVVAKKLAQGYVDVTDNLPEEIREYVRVEGSTKTSESAEHKSTKTAKAGTKAK